MIVTAGPNFIPHEILEGENAFPVVLPVHHGPFVERRGIEGLVEATEGRFSIVGIFAFRVGVMNDGAEAHAATDRRPL